MGWVLLLLLLSFCGRSPSPLAPEPPMASIAPHILWKTARGATLPSGVDSIRLTAQSASLAAPRVKTFPFIARNGLLDSLPVGIDVLLIVEGLDSQGRVLFRGEYRISNLGSTPFSIDIEVSAVTPLPPTGLEIRPFSQAGFLLTWKDNAYNEQGFAIERRSAYSSLWDTVAVATSFYHIDTSGLNAGNKYHYRISAYNAAGTSLSSDTASLLLPSGSGNNPPLFITRPFTFPDSLFADSLFSGTLQAIDGDPGTSLRYYTANPPPGLILDSTTGAFTWRPTVPGTYTLIFKVRDPAFGEDSLAWTLKVKATSAYIGFDPPAALVHTGNDITLSLTCANLTGVFGFSCEILCDSRILKSADSLIKAGPFLGDNTLKLFKVNGDTLSIGITRMAGDTAASGSGVLARMKFRAVGFFGTANVRIRDNTLKIIDKNGNNVGYLGTLTRGTSVVSVTN